MPPHTLRCFVGRNRAPHAEARFCPCSGVSKEKLVEAVDESEWTERIPDHAEWMQEADSRCDVHTTKDACEAAGCNFTGEEGMVICSQAVDPLGPKAK